MKNSRRLTIRRSHPLHRHLMRYQQGRRDEDNLAAILCNAMFIVHTEEMIKRGVLPQSLDDLPKYQAATTPTDMIPETLFPVPV